MKKLYKIFSLEYKDSERSFGLDLMRTIAIVMVLIVHSELITKNYFPKINFLTGIDGVDVFFVLSGFLIGRILIKTFDTESFSLINLFDFWKRRWFRTLPNYFLILFLLLFFDFSEYTSSTNFHLSYLFFLQNFNSPHPSFFNVAWSLSVEEWFYILFPFCLFVFRLVFKQKHFKTFVFISILIFYFFSTIYRLYVVNQNFLDETIFLNLIRKAVLFRFDTIIFGVFAAWISIYFQAFWRLQRYKILILGIFIIITHLIFYQNVYYKYYLSSNVISFGLAMFIPFLSSLPCKNKYILKIITYISLTSYSIYLIHFSFVLILVLKIFDVTNLIGVLLAVFTYYTISFLLSILLYKYYEKPFTNIREKFHFK